MIDLSDILEIVDVMDAGFRKVVGVNNTAQSTQGMELVSIIINFLRGTVAEVRSFFKAGPSHFTASATCRPTNFNGPGVYTEIILSSIYSAGYQFADFLTQTAGCLPSVIELTTGDQIRYF